MSIEPTTNHTQAIAPTTPGNGAAIPPTAAGPTAAAGNDAVGDLNDLLALLNLTLRRLRDILQDRNTSQQQLAFANLQKTFDAKLKAIADQASASTFLAWGSIVGSGVGAAITCFSPASAGLGNMVSEGAKGGFEVTGSQNSADAHIAKEAADVMEKMSDNFTKTVEDTKERMREAARNLLDMLRQGNELHAQLAKAVEPGR